VRRHRPRDQQDEILHSFKTEERVLWTLFVAPKGDMTPVAYRLCPKCGVSMERADSKEGTIWSCAICGCEIREE